MQADALSWMQTTLTDFGLGGIAVRNLIDFLKGMLGSSNAAVRTNAIGVLGAIRMFAGPGNYRDDSLPECRVANNRHTAYVM